jgi:hypothetical protein
MFVAGISGTVRDACARLVLGLVISSNCNIFLLKCTKQMVFPSHKFIYQVLILIFLKV